jgi:hypothetical protein
MLACKGVGRQTVFEELLTSYEGLTHLILVKGPLLITYCLFPALLKLPVDQVKDRACLI